MRILVTEKLGKKLQKSNNKSLLKKMQKVTETLENVFLSNGIQDSRIHKLNFRKENIFSYRIDNKLRLIFTYTKDEENQYNITLLDIIKHNEMDRYVSASLYDIK